MARRNALLLAVLALVLSCESEPSPPPPPPRPPTPPAKALQVLGSISERRAKMEALAHEAQTWGETLQQQFQRFATEHVYEKVPKRLDPKTISLRVRVLLGSKAKEIEVGDLPPPARTLPESVPLDPPFVLEPDDVLALVPVTLKVQAFEPFALSDATPFLFVRDQADHTVHLQTPVFRDVRMPRFVLPAADVDADLKAAGAPSMGELLSGPHRTFASDLQGEYVRYAAAKADVEPLLPNLAKVRLNDARLAAYEGLVKEAQRSIRR